MAFTKNDLTSADNLLKAINRGSFRFTGAETLIFAESVRWLAELAITMRKALEAPPIQVVGDPTKTDTDP